MKHIRKAVIAILLLLITLPCIATAATRYTGYISKNTYVYKKASTSSKKVAIARNTKVYVIGTSGRFYKIQNTKNGAKGYVLKGCVSKKKVETPTPTDTDPDDTGTDDTGTGTDTGALSWKSKVVKLEWFKNGKDVMKKGTYAYLYDVDTGIKLRIKRMGGSNHADVPARTTPCPTATRPSRTTATTASSACTWWAARPTAATRSTRTTRPASTRPTSGPTADHPSI